MYRTSNFFLLLKYLFQSKKKLLVLYIINFNWLIYTLLVKKCVETRGTCFGKWWYEWMKTKLGMFGVGMKYQRSKSKFTKKEVKNKNWIPRPNSNGHWGLTRASGVQIQSTSEDTRKLEQNHIDCSPAIRYFLEE